MRVTNGISDAVGNIDYEAFARPGWFGRDRQA